MGEMSERQRRAVEAWEAHQEAGGASQPRPASVPPGWYPHPTMAATRRYWDGQAWTEHIAPVDPAAEGMLPTHGASGGAPAKDNTDALVIAGFIMAALFPIGGFIAGCVLLARRAGLGVAVMLLSVGATFFWYQLLFAANDDIDCATENVQRELDGLPPTAC